MLDFLAPFAMGWMTPGGRQTFDAVDDVSVRSSTRRNIDAGLWLFYIYVL
jgi:hypothetical protein